MYRPCRIGVALVLATSIACVPALPAEETAVETPGGEVIDLGGVRVRRDRKTFEFDGEIVMREGIVELLVCAGGSKEHESIVATNVPARFLHAAVLMLGAAPGRPVQFQGDPAAPAGARVTFEVAYKEADRWKRVRAEQLVHNAVTNAPMDGDGWVFVGSATVDTQEGPRYLAELTGALVVTYNDPSAVFDNPRAFGADDTVYQANTEQIPPSGTPVTVIGTLHPPNPPATDADGANKP